MDDSIWQHFLETVATPIVTTFVRPSKASNLVDGRLNLYFDYDAVDQRTRLLVREQQPPLRVVRAFPLPYGGTLVHLHNLSGGVLGGDRLALTVAVAPGAYAQLTSTGATRLYRSRPEVPPAIQTNSIQVGENGLLEYLPDPLIPFADSRYRQQTRIMLSDGAGLFWWETVAPGRLARGERFAYDLLQLELALIANSIPVAIERFKLAPKQRTLSSLARLGSYCYFSNFYICRAGLEAARWLALEQSLSTLAASLTLQNEVLWGVSTLVAHGLVIRCLSCQGRHIPAGLFAFWQEAKRELYGRDAILPRKMY
jgi:urease accessory protein